MAKKDYLTPIKESVINLDFTGIVPAAQEAMAAGLDPGKVINEAIAPGMAMVGDKFEKGEYFLSELVVAAEVMKEGMKIINPYLKAGSLKATGKVVIATVEGDHHDLGKNIVTTLLRAQGFEVIDLGIDVPTARLIAAVKEHQPDILGLSALLTITMTKMGEAVEALQAASLRKKVKVIVGGTPVTQEFAESIRVDHRAANALEGVKKCVEWVTAKRGGK